MKNESLLILASAPQKYMSPDIVHRYRQNADFSYLCGFIEPSAVLCLSKQNEHNQKFYLFVREFDSKTVTYQGHIAGTEAAKAIIEKCKNMKKSNAKKTLLNIASSAVASRNWTRSRTECWKKGLSKWIFVPIHGTDFLLTPISFVKISFLSTFDLGNLNSDQKNEFFVRIRVCTWKLNFFFITEMRQCEFWNKLSLLIIIFQIQDWYGDNVLLFMICIYDTHLWQKIIEFSLTFRPSYEQIINENSAQNAYFMTAFMIWPIWRFFDVTIDVTIREFINAFMTAKHKYNTFDVNTFDVTHKYKSKKRQISETCHVKCCLWNWMIFFPFMFS